MTTIRERLRSTDLVTREAARAEMGRKLVDTASAMLDPDATSSKRTTLLDVLIGKDERAECDLRRALVDMTTTDAPGMAAPGVVPLALPPPRPLLMMARPFGDMMGAPDLSNGSVIYWVPSVTSMPTPNVDAPEKSDGTAAGKLTITHKALAGHQVDVRVDISAAVAQRSTQPEAIDAQLTASVAMAAEAAMVNDLAAACTGTATTVLDAVALALDFGAPVAVIADAKAWPGAAQVIAPLLVASPGSIVLVPVAGSTAGAVVASQADLMLYANPVTRLSAYNPTELAYDVGLTVHVLAALGHGAYATHLAPGP
jgi:hypothetical protein